MPEHYRSQPPSTHLSALAILLAATAVFVFAIWGTVALLHWAFA